MITTKGLNVFGQGILNVIDHGYAIIDGAGQQVDLYKTELNGNEVVVYLLFDGQYEGNFTSFKLRDASNNVLVEQADSIDKIYNKLLLITFKFTLSERVVVG